MVLVEDWVGEDRDGAPTSGSVVELGDWLAATQSAQDQWLATWLEALVAFDRDQGWAADGMISCADWLVVRARHSRAAAYEKLRVGHELRRRPVVAAAFADGRLSWSGVRAITRAVGASPDVDEALITLADAGTVTDVERAVRTYLRFASQDSPPADPAVRRGVRMVPLGDGTTRVEIILTDLEAAELDTALTATAAHLAEPVDNDAGPVDESPAETGDPGPTWMQQRADAVMVLARSGLADTPAGDDRYLVHLMVDHTSSCIVGGEALDDAAMAEVRCDCSEVTHHRRGGEVVALGRRSRTWSTAQRRAITVRDGGRCRWPGCTHRHVDVHHVTAWDDGGRTDVANGMLLCPRHHSLIHRGFTTAGSPAAAITFHRPDGTPIAATVPLRQLSRQS